eukprot:TRINITY_DN2689_c0_g1_i5.p1 TRINITY_DN2689_c0_g1~~TRINITY_DN2689_c0_g1_i5.p1  ORF type:complete len:211 (-),score=44.02 TRINITY_DN2689_c0_g1_i5:248-880(-)
MIRRPPRSTLSSSSAASDVYKRQMYVSTDQGFHVKGYLFVCVWYVVFCADQLYLRRIVDVVPMTNWGRVYYSNLLGSLPLPLLALAAGERPPLVWTNVAIMVFALSLVLSTAISYFAWQTRSMLSATTFSVLGNICKLVTIAVNLTIWDQHANATGLACLLLCLGSALFYEQAPMRKVEVKADDGLMMDEEALIAAQDSAMDEESESKEV